MSAPDRGLAVTGELDPGPYREAGWRVVGRLAATPYEDPRDSPSYVDVQELLADDRAAAVALDGSVPALAEHLPALMRAGKDVVLPAPAPLDDGLLRRSRQVEVRGEIAVALHRRWEPWARAVAAALPLAGGQPRQVTVRGWPTGERHTVELVDLVRGWCGDVIAVTAAAEALPAAALPDGSRVAWSLLTASGATVLVSHEGSPVPLARLTFATARLEAAADDVRWEGGAQLPLPPGELGPRAGVVCTARWLLDGESLGRDTWPWPADLGDLLTASRVLAALRASAGSGAPVRTA